MDRVAWGTQEEVLGGLAKEVSLEGRTHQAVQEMMERLLRLQGAWKRAGNSLFWEQRVRKVSGNRWGW